MTRAMANGRSTRTKTLCALATGSCSRHLIVADPYRKILANDQDSAQLGMNQPPRLLQLAVPVLFHTPAIDLE